MVRYAHSSAVGDFDRERRSEAGDLDLLRDLERLLDLDRDFERTEERDLLLRGDLLLLRDGDLLLRLLRPGERERERLRLLERLRGDRLRLLERE